MNYLDGYTQTIPEEETPSWEAYLEASALRLKAISVLEAEKAEIMEEIRQLAEKEREPVFTSLK